MTYIKVFLWQDHSKNASYLAGGQRKNLCGTQIAISDPVSLRPYVVPEFEPRLTACKASSLTSLAL